MNGRKQEGVGSPVGPDNHPSLLLLFLFSSSTPVLIFYWAWGGALQKSSSFIRLSALGLEDKALGYARAAVLTIYRVPRYEWLHTDPQNTGLPLSIGNGRECILGRRQPPLADQSLRDSVFVPLCLSALVWGLRD